MGDVTYINVCLCFWIFLQSTLVKIFHEKVPSYRHQKFRYGTVAEKNSLKRKTGCGPIQDEEIVSCKQDLLFLLSFLLPPFSPNRNIASFSPLKLDKIVETLQTWYFEVQEETLGVSNYIYDVWLPEVCLSVFLHLSVCSIYLSFVRPSICSFILLFVFLSVRTMQNTRSNVSSVGPSSEKNVK